MKLLIKSSQAIGALGSSVVFVFALSNVWPHGGEDHSGASLSPPGSRTNAGVIHVAKETQFLLGIETARAAKETVPRRLKALGRVTHPPAHRAEVHSPFEGLLVSNDGIPLPGQKVKKGEEIALVEQVINASETVSLTTETTKTESELRQAREEAALARLELNRVEKLGEAVSKRRLAQAKAASIVANQKLKGLEKALAQLRAAQKSTGDGPRIVPIKAPISGVVVASHVTPGEYIKPEKQLFDILDTSSVWVQADVYERDLPLVEDAHRAFISSEAYPEQEFLGELVFVGQRIDPTSRTVKVVFVVENKEGRLRDGMFVKVLIETQRKETGTMFPKAAVVNEGGQSMVYVKTAPETFVARPVEIKGVWGDRVMTATGVNPGDILVVQGMYQIRSSAKRP